MEIKMKKIVLALALSGLAIPSFADNARGWYAGINAARVDIGLPSFIERSDGFERNFSNTGGSLDITTMELTGGFKHRWYLGGEFRVGFGLTSESREFEGAAITENVPLLDPDTEEPILDADGNNEQITVSTGVNEESLFEEININHYESIYYRAESANEIAKLYGLLGFTSLSTDIEGGTDSNSGFSYGYGISFITGKHMNLNIEYRSLINNDDLDIETYSLGLDYRF